MLGDLCQPLIIKIVVVRRWRQQLDHATKTAVWIQHRTARAIGVVGSPSKLTGPAILIVLCEDLIKKRKILFLVANKDRTIQHVVVQAFADFALSTTAYCTRFVAKDTFANRSNQSP